MFKGFLKPVSKVIKRIDKTAKIFDSLQALEKTDVLVGIPEEKASSRGGELNQAELAFLLEHGVRDRHMTAQMEDHQEKGASFSQAWDAFVMAEGDPMFHIPPRPFLEPAIEANKDKIAQLQKDIILAALDGKKELVRTRTEKLGMFAQNVVKDWFTNPANGWPENAPSTIAAKGSDRPNIDTGQTRNAITYVVRDRNSHD